MLLQLMNATQRVNVSSCVFDDISAHGVALGQTNDESEQRLEHQNADLHVVNCSFRSSPAEYHGCNPVWAGFVRGATIAHNDVGRCTHTAIALGWGWKFAGCACDPFVQMVLLAKCLE